MGVRARPLPGPALMTWPDSFNFHVASDMGTPIRPILQMR